MFNAFKVNLAGESGNAGIAGTPDSSAGAPPSGNPADMARSEAASRAESLAASAAPRRGRPRKNPADSGGDQRSLQAEVDAAIRAQLEGLYAPEAWSALLAMPADAAQVWTGKKHWELSPEERKTLGVTGSAAARTMMITNPKSLAFFMLGSALLSAYLPRAVRELRDMKLAEKAKPAPDAAKP